MFFVFLIYYICFLICGGGGEGWASCHDLYMEVRNLMILSFHHMGPRDGIQVVRFGGGKRFYLLSHS